MNKSDDGNNKGTIFLMDNIAVAKKKIMSAKTDNLNQVHFHNLKIKIIKI